MKPSKYALLFPLLGLLFLTYTQSAFAASTTGPTSPTNASTTRPVQQRPAHVQVRAQLHMAFHNACAHPTLGHARCFALVSQAGTAFLSGIPYGYGPADLQDAYVLPSSTAGSSQTVAIVDAYNDPNAESDLAVYRSTYGLSPCTTANGCFSKVNQSGTASSYPASDVGWSEEISLDLDMVSAICPRCHILLVEANDNSYINLGTSVNTAVRLGATEVSNSYGGGEFSGQTLFGNTYYNHPGVPITASTGDNGYGVAFPASSQYVTAVGGTSLSIVGGYWNETAWSGAGSGCSSYEAKPAWQKDSGCSKRTIADVSAVADPYTGVAVYDSYQVSGWLVFGGTSASAPIIASVYALAGNGGSINNGSYPYYHADNLFDIYSGSTGSCAGSYLCTSKTGYDGPTGLGTPDSVDAF